MAVKVIYCIGDSHSSFFSGYDEIQPIYPEPSRDRYVFLKSFRLGAVLAYNLNKLNTKEQGREKLLKLKEELPRNATLLLCFGEIDCRCHILKQADLQKAPIESVIDSCIRNYFQVIDDLIFEDHFNVMLWNAVPTSDLFDNDYPFYGDHLERNKCTISFNKRLEEECKKRSVPFISIQNKLLKRNFRTETFYFFDSIHLSQRAMPFALIELFKFERTSVSARDQVVIRLLMYRSMYLLFRKMLKDSFVRILTDLGLVKR
jgi:hypothetical protein